MVLSRIRRRLASPIPKPSPSNKPSAKFMVFLGLDGALGTTPYCTVETLTGESTPCPCSSRFPTVAPNCSATALAIAAARFGLLSVTVSAIKTVSSGADAVICLASAAGVISNCNFSITGFKVNGELIICAYDLTRCCEKLDPVASAEISNADAGVETKSSACD